MFHMAHMLLFSGLISAFFALIAGRPGRRLRYGLILWAALGGGGILVSLLMYPFS
ncbi:MAG: hypothetical protein Q9Q40_06790 [Acidobacteriota bacterium]|nr:hypothetical protein [Acidobacteriota bacterium]MDQ7088292.1 hypothetical protein [Acidobacteriota bacterium]